MFMVYTNHPATPRYLGGLSAVARMLLCEVNLHDIQHMFVLRDGLPRGDRGIPLGWGLPIVSVATPCGLCLGVEQKWYLRTSPARRSMFQRHVSLRFLLHRGAPCRRCDEVGVLRTLGWSQGTSGRPRQHNTGVWLMPPTPSPQPLF